MPQHFITLPNLGIADQPAFLSLWLTKRGALVKAGEPVVEVLCGAATVDLPAPVDGRLTEKLVAEDEEIIVGQQLAVIEPRKQV